MFHQINTSKISKSDLKSLILIIGFMMAPIFVYALGVVLLSNPERKFSITDSYAYLLSFVVCFLAIYLSNLRHYIVIKEQQLRKSAICLILALIYSLLLAIVLDFFSMYHTASGNTLFHIETILLAPFLEEIVFRGISIEYLKKHNIPENLIIAITSVMFGLSHMPSWIQIYTFILGVILSIVNLKERNIFYCILIHFGINLSLVVFNFL